jgi:LytR cell envelope-related transcriptional attenuator
MSIPSATLSIHNFIHSVGADCGFAAIIGLALVVILFFAHARETANLRDGLDDAHERIQSLEQQIQQLRYQQVSQQRAAAAMPATGTMPPVAPRPGGPQTGALRTSAAASALAQRPLAGATAAVAPAAMPGLAAPSLGSATKLIPDTALPPPGVNGNGDTTIIGNGETIVGAPGVTAAAGRLSGPVAPRPSAEGQVPRRTVPLSNAQGGRSLLDEEPPRRRWWLIALSSIVAIAVIVVVLLVALGGGGSTPTSHHKPPTSKKAKTPPFDTGKYHVSVLNGTAVSGLAADVFHPLGQKGFKQGQITNAATQTETTSIVYYVKKSDMAAAQHVAGVLGIGAKSVKPVTQSAMQSCATSPSNVKTRCTANVVVSVGSDQAHRAQSNTITTG